MATKMIDQIFRISSHVKVAKRLEKVADELGRLRDEIVEIAAPGSAAIEAEEKVGHAQGNINTALSFIQSGIGSLYLDGDGKDEVVYEVEDVG